MNLAVVCYNWISNPPRWCGRTGTRPSGSRRSYFRADVPLSYELQDVLQTECERYGIEYALALGLIETESSFNPEAVSKSGCIGLMQLNPDYAWWFEEQTGSDYKTPCGNVKCGIWYLNYLTKKYDGSVEKALVAYNQGSYQGVMTNYAENVLSAAKKWGESLCP